MDNRLLIFTRVFLVLREGWRIYMTRLILRTSASGLRLCAVLLSCRGIPVSAIRTGRGDRGDRGAGCGVSSLDLRTLAAATSPDEEGARELEAVYPGRCRSGSILSEPAYPHRLAFCEPKNGSGEQVPMAPDPPAVQG